MLQWREAEVQHGRVAMLAVLGMLIVEEPIEYHPLFEAYNKDIGVSVGSFFFVHIMIYHN